MTGGQGQASRQVAITNQRGLHARASAKFVNLASQIDAKIEVIAGVNLPMLIRLEGARKAMDVRSAVAAAREAGRKYISVASEILGEAAA